MLQRYQNRVSMWRAVIRVLDRHRSTWNSLAAFLTAYEELQDLLERLEKAEGVQLIPIKGVTADRDGAEAHVLDLILDLAGGFKAYAIDTENSILYQKVAITRSTLMQMTDNDCYARLEYIMIAIRPLGGSMAIYGITPDMIVEADKALEDYRTVIRSPRTAIGERKTATEDIPDLLRAGRKVLDKTDGLIRRFRTDDPQLISEYRNARIIVDSGIRHDGKDRDEAPGAAGD